MYFGSVAIKQGAWIERPVWIGENILIRFHKVLHQQTKLLGLDVPSLVLGLHNLKNSRMVHFWTRNFLTTIRIFALLMLARQILEI